VTRILRTVATKGPRELWFRTCERARTNAERIDAAVTARTWKRKHLISRLSGSLPANSDVQRALKNQNWQAAGELLQRHFLSRPSRFPLNPATRQAITVSILEQFPKANDEARALGNRLLDGRRNLLGYKDLSVAPSGEIDWHFDPVHVRRAPRRFWASIPYLDPELGDHKIIWELNRHQHWLMLGRAAWLTNDRRYADRFRQELLGWLRNNPPLVGINWSSMLELAFRTLSWIWSLHFFVAPESNRNGDSADAVWLVDLLLGLDEQLNHISRHLSTYFSPNTHLLGEGLALYVAGRVFPEFASAVRYERLGRAILRNEALRQVCRDGGHAERSAHYHRYVLDFYLLALTIARLTEDQDADLFAEVASRLATFCRAFVGDNGILPTIGDDDGGSLFPICDRRPADVTDSLALAASLLQRPELAVGDPPEETLWLLGGDRGRLRWPNRSPACESQLFPETGYAVMRSRLAHAIFDVGPHGFLNGGHAHADALALVMSIGGRPLLVDPGTSTYTMDRDRRDLFRSTAMHNTATVDRRDQSIAASPFHWRSAANAKVRLWRTSRGFDAVEAEHDGYLPAVHRRAILRDDSELWLIADHFLGTGHHQLDVRWHLDSAWSLAARDRQSARAQHADGSEVQIASTGSELTSCEGDPFGWRAPEYGQCLPALTLGITHVGHAPLSVITAIAPNAVARKFSLETATVTTDRTDSRHRVAVLGDCGEDRFVALFSTETLGAEHSDRPSLQHVDVGGDGALRTDARIALLRLSPGNEPRSLILVDGTQAAWTGPRPFNVAGLTSAADLHLDREALSRLGQHSQSSADRTEPTLCAE